MVFVVYNIKNTINGKLYVGITNNLNARWNKHVYDARGNSSCVIHRAIRKYGENNFILDVIQECENKEELLKQEQILIQQLQSHVSQGGYNETWGGEAPMLGRKHSKETIAKISNSLKGITYKNRKTVSTHTKRLLGK